MSRLRCKAADIKQMREEQGISMQEAKRIMFVKQIKTKIEALPIMNNPIRSILLDMLEYMNEF